MQLSCAIKRVSRALRQLLRTAYECLSVASFSVMDLLSVIYFSVTTD